MCKGIGSLVEYGRKLMAWRDVKRDREKKVDNFFAPNGGFAWCGGFMGVDPNDPVVNHKNAVLFQTLEEYGKAFYKK